MSKISTNQLSIFSVRLLNSVSNCVSLFMSESLYISLTYMYSLFWFYAAISFVCFVTIMVRTNQLEAYVHTLPLVTLFIVEYCQLVAKLVQYLIKTGCIESVELTNITTSIIVFCWIKQRFVYLIHFNRSHLILRHGM